MGRKRGETSDIINNVNHDGGSRSTVRSLDGELLASGSRRSNREFIKNLNKRGGVKRVIMWSIP